MLRAVRTPASRLLLVWIPLFLACERGTEAPAPADTPASAAAATSSVPDSEPAAELAAARGANERPLPAFGGTTFEGKSVSVSDFLGRRLLIFFFRPGEEAARPAAQAMATIATLQGKHNFAILGVASGASTPDARAFVDAQGLDFTVLNDAGESIARRFGVKVAAAMLFADAEGYLTGAMGAVVERVDDPATTIEDQVREQLRLPASEPALLEPGLGEYPPAPDFTAGTLDGETVKLSDLRGRPVVLVFFLYTCPHCHHALQFLRSHLATIPEAERPALLGVSLSGSPSTVRDELKSKALDFFPVAIDPDGSLAKRYGVTGGVPDILLLDAEGRIRARTQGWRDAMDPPLMKMRLAVIAGAKPPLLLHATGYSGNEVCGVCHESQAETWRFTKHATAFDTLVRHSAERNAECVSCHVVGFDQSGGYSFKEPQPWLEGVGCETCHGRGGGHLSPEPMTPAASVNYEPVCATCHDAKHSLGFEYATFGPRVSHAANAHLLELPVAEKRARLAELGSTRKPLFRDAAYVGNDACQSCHPAEFATWEASLHGRAMDSVAREGKTRDAACQACHTTAFGKPGGFPSGADPLAHADLARVGCEDCHGPGGDHVGENDRRDGTILSLTDKCDSCVILQICGGCHDEANDPGFEFRVEEKIEAQRHGTIEPSSTRAPQTRLEALPEQIGAAQRTLTAGGR